MYRGERITRPLKEIRHRLFLPRRKDDGRIIRVRRDKRRFERETPRGIARQVAKVCPGITVPMGRLNEAVIGHLERRDEWVDQRRLHVADLERRATESPMAQLFRKTIERNSILHIIGEALGPQEPMPGRTKSGKP
ncbi:hypothetical protein SxD43FB_17325 [Sphingobium sp. D43FB]|nr:hypothetical protein SxD43FB_17325 [Sphingobium sp. D43FB]